MTRTLLAILAILFSWTFAYATPEMDAMKTVAHQIGEIIKSTYNQLPYLFAAGKEPNDLISELEVQIEETCRTFLQKNFPEYGFIGDETGDEEKKPLRSWVIEALDGTPSLSRMGVDFSFSLALLDFENNEIIAGVVYNPITNELFTAEKEKGAYLNGQRIYVAKNDLKKSWIKIELNAPINPTSWQWQRIARLIPYAESVRYKRTSTVLDIAYVAAGKIDGFIGSHVNIWDIAAGLILLKEAGGVITTQEGQPISFQQGHADVAAVSSTIFHPVQGLLMESRTFQEGKSHLMPSF